MQNADKSKRCTDSGKIHPPADSATNLLVFGNRVEKLRVQLGVVLGQGLVAIVIDELHHSEEGKRLGEAVPRLSVVDLY